jgi:sigma-B regulation protein RsbU (phosphoserine phosphatase)
MQQRVLKPLAQRVHAGDWVMRNALVRSPQSRLADIAEQHRAVDSERLIEQLDEWLAGYEKEFHDEVNLRTAKMRHDLDLARDFQRAILERPYPRVPDVYVKGRLRLEFCHSYHPASALGGDFFNIIKLGRSTAGIFVADVMGHGTRSALITSMLRTLIGDLMGLGRNAPHFLSEMNKQFHGILLSVPNPLFASAFYFVADTTARVATYSSAGHPPPYHIRRHVGHVSRLTVPPPRGAALGAIADEEYSGGHCRLVKDDVFIFYTDGVYEAFNSAREEFGVHRMEKALKKHMYGSLQDIVDGLLRAVLEFAGDEPMADDVCIVGMEVTTRAPGEEAPVTGGE